MAGGAPTDRLRGNATEVASVLVTGIWLAAPFTGRRWWLVALLSGSVVDPLVVLLFGDDEDR